MLHIRAEEADDLPALSALVQDMAIKAGDVNWSASSRRLVLLGNRFRWEAKARTRTRAALRFDHVQKAQRTNWPPTADTVLALLAIVEEQGALILHFSGSAALRLETEVIDISLDDLSGPWGASSQPAH